jgi:hypothetical protein
MHGNERPGDLFIENWARGQPAAFDVSVIHPSAYSTPASKTTRRLLKGRQKKSGNTLSSMPSTLHPSITNSAPKASEAGRKLRSK